MTSGTLALCNRGHNKLTTPKLRYERASGAGTMLFIGLITRMVVLLTFIERSCKASDSCPTSSDLSYGSSCYYFHSESKSWDMAQKACEGDGGVLTSLNSETEVDKVLDGIRDMAKSASVDYYWTGLTNQDSGEYRWGDGTALNNGKIEAKINVDITGGRGCVSVESTNTNWNSGKVFYLRNCSLTYAYVCEVNATAAAWSPWGAWSKCSVTCGSGTRTRSRNCTSGSRWSSWTTTRCSGISSEQEQCQTSDCPASDPSWSTWTTWGSCSVTCGQGQKLRSRSCGNSTLDKQSCPGNNNETTSCQIQSCPEWSDWGSWGSCSETCGEGERTRQRSCTTGDNKDCTGSQEDKENCNLDHCTAGRWAEWSPWTSCSSTCGKGNRTRTRSCFQDDGTPSSGCKGPESAVGNCVPQCPGLSKVEFVQAIQSDLDDETTRKAMAWAKETSKRRENVFNTKGIRDCIITGHVIQTFAVSSKVRCAMKCLSFDACGSFNYEYKSDGNGLHTCQINSASSEVATANLQKHPGYIVYDYSMFTPFQVNGN